MIVHVFIRCHLIWLRGQSSCWWWQQTKSKISSWFFTFYIRCHLIWLRGHSTCWWWQQTKSKISSYMFTFLSAAIWFDFGDFPAAGGDSKRSPRSAHTCSRFYPLPFDLTLGTFQLLVVTANEVQDQLIHVHVFIRCHLIWFWGLPSCWWWQQTKSKISSYMFTSLSAAIWFDFGDFPAAGGDSKRSPRSAHTCSRFYPLPFDLTLGTFQLLVVTANEVQDQLMVVHVLYPLPFDLT